MKPTRLYIKRHAITGLKYLGKSTRKDAMAYKGSGKYWLKHLHKHGSDVQTLWVSEWFYNEDELRTFALMISEFYDVAASPNWANAMPEDGSGGWDCINTALKDVIAAAAWSPEVREKRDATRKKNGFAQGENNSQYGKPRKEETKRKIRETLLKKKHGRVAEELS
jgi:hypothetical protein